MQIGCNDAGYIPFAGVCPKVPVAEQKKNNAIRTGKYTCPKKRFSIKYLTQ